MYPITGSIMFDSNSDVVASNIADLSMKFPSPLKLPQDTKTYLKIVNCKIPLIVYNLSPSLSNNKIRYSINAGGAYTEIDFGSGIFEITDIFSYVQQELFNNSHYETLDSGQQIVPFSIQANTSTSKGAILINTNWSDTTQIIVDLTNNSTSTFYLLYGFLVGESILDGSVKTIQISTNNVNIYDSQFAIKCDIIESYKGGFQDDEILYFGNLTGAKNGIMRIKSSDLIIQPIRPGITYINKINIQFVDRNDTLLVFGPDTSVDSNITMELQILTHIK
jgi:hypothetical protein